jgi:hypothetical protein
MIHTMRVGSVLFAAALGLTALASTAFAQSAPQCPMSGTASDWGFNSTGYIMIASGGSCLFSINISGEILSSRVTQRPAHGALRRINRSSYVYASTPGYRGSDTFSVQATGKSPTSSGTSVVTVNATLQ